MKKPAVPSDHQIHPIPPLYDSHSRILILGSFPSVRSREDRFFYAHPQNRFWPVLASLFFSPVPSGVEEKREFLLSYGIALWDVIGACEITGSSDSSIKNVVPNDIDKILAHAPIQKIFTNGGTAQKLYQKHIFPVTGRDAVPLPSSSPAYASVSCEQLCAAWRTILEAAVPDFLPPSPGHQNGGSIV